MRTQREARNEWRLGVPANSTVNIGTSGVEIGGVFGVKRGRRRP